MYEIETATEWERKLMFVDQEEVSAWRSTDFQFETNISIDLLDNKNETEEHGKPPKNRGLTSIKMTKPIREKERVTRSSLLGDDFFNSHQFI